MLRLGIFWGYKLDGEDGKCYNVLKGF